MPQITQPREAITFTAGELDLNSAEFLANVRAIYKIVDGTNNFAGYIPGADFNPFSSLETGVSYIIDKKPNAAPFVIPDGIQLPDQGAADGASATIDSLRALQQVPINSRFYVTDEGKEGPWYVDGTDTTSPDNLGTVLVNLAGQRIKRAFTGAYHSSWFGLVPDSREAMETNAAILDRMIKLNEFGHVFVNGPGKKYYIGQSPDKRIGSPCISLVDSQGHFQCDDGVQLITKPGYVGIQTGRTSGECNVWLDNVNIQHDGGPLNPEFLQGKKPDGTWSEEWGNDYKTNGLNMWGGGRITNITIYGYPGHGMCVFGATTVRFNGASIPIAGTIGAFNGDATFTPDDKSLLQKINIGWTTVINGKTRNVGGTGGESFTIGFADGGTEAPGTHVTGIAYPAGKNLLADSIVADGVNNISSCNGCGIFTTGDEANQSSFNYFRIGNCGGWGVCDSSLLGNRYEDLHGTANNMHWNDFSVVPPILRRGTFTNRGNINARTVLVGGYREEGNQGPDDASAFTSYWGGLYTEGVADKGHGIIDGRMHGIFSGGYDGTGGRIDYGNALNFFSNTAPRYALGLNSQGWQFTDGFGNTYWRASLGNDAVIGPANVSRVIKSAYLATSDQLINGLFRGTRPNFASLQNTQAYLAGDEFANDLTNPNEKLNLTTPTGWLCILSGTGTVQNVEDGLTLTANGNEFTLNRVSTKLEPGQVLLINNIRTKLVFSSADKLSWSTDTQVGQGGSQPVQFAPALFRPLGQGIGTTAQRPVLTGLAGPWQYFNTESNVWNTWDGSTWR